MSDLMYPVGVVLAFCYLLGSWLAVGTIIQGRRRDDKMTGGILFFLSAQAVLYATGLVWTAMALRGMR